MGTKLLLLICSLIVVAACNSGSSSDGQKSKRPLTNVTDQIEGVFTEVSDEDFNKIGVNPEDIRNLKTAGELMPFTSIKTGTKTTNSVDIYEIKNSYNGAEGSMSAMKHKEILSKFEDSVWQSETEERQFSNGLADKMNCGKNKYVLGTEKYLALTRSERVPAGPCKSNLGDFEGNVNPNLLYSFNVGTGCFFTLTEKYESPTLIVNKIGYFVTKGGQKFKAHFVKSKKTAEANCPRANNKTDTMLMTETKTIIKTPDIIDPNDSITEFGTILYSYTRQEDETAKVTTLIKREEALNIEIP